MAVPDKLAQSDLLCLGSGLIIKGGFFSVGGKKLWRQNHKADSDGGQQKPGKRANINHALPSGKSEQGRSRLLKIHELIFKIILNYKMMPLICIFQKLQTAFYRHDLAPLGHMRRGNINHIAVFIPIVDFIAVIRKNSTSMDKRRCGKGYLFEIRIYFPDQRAQNLQKTLEAGTYHNVIRGTQNVPALPDISSQRFPEIRLPLGLSVSEHALILAKGAFHITAPQIEAEAFPVNAGGGKVIAVVDFIPSVRLTAHMVVRCDLRYVVAALGLCHNIAVCGKLQIGGLNGGAGKLQLLGAFAKRRHFAARSHFPIQNQLFVIFINLHVKMCGAILVFCNV